MKKKTLFLAVVAICFAILASGTLAYFTAEDTAHNVITTSGVGIQIEEWLNEVGTPYPNSPIPVMPGTEVSKIVTIKNTEASSYIRARMETVISRPDGSVMELTPEALASIITLTVNSADWSQKDGDSQWWYYTGSVDTDTSTAPFLTKVAFSGLNMTNEYQNCTVEIIVKAQAVQTANNGTSALTAAGWPEA